MGAALEWFRESVCLAEGHSHAEAGELDCLLQRLATERARQPGEGKGKSRSTKGQAN